MMKNKSRSVPKSPKNGLKQEVINLRLKLEPSVDINSLVATVKNETIKIRDYAKPDQNP